MNILLQPIFTTTRETRVSLPGLFALMARDEVRGFAALRPHQRPAWHMFLVQIGALALWHSGRQRIPVKESDWLTALRQLTPHFPDDEPWLLAVEDQQKPAFLQPPAPEGLKWHQIQTPDELDMLITARNHDLKQRVAIHALAEDWIYALVSLQTCEGFGGRGNYGIARMNGGFASRPLLGLVPARSSAAAINPSAWWARDVRLLTAFRRQNKPELSAAADENALLWCPDWPSGHRFDLRNLDPWFVEVCRRIRLQLTGGELSAQRAPSRDRRIDAKMLKGNTGDPWAPVHRKEGKSLTLGSWGFDYRKLCELLYSGDWELPLLARPTGQDTGNMLLVAEALSRGQNRTNGFKSRVVPIPGEIMRHSFSTRAAAEAVEQENEIRTFDNAMGYALALVAAGGSVTSIRKNHYDYSIPARKRLRERADRAFFASLWHRLAASCNDKDFRSDPRYAFLVWLQGVTLDEFAVALPMIPCASVRRPRAAARGRRILNKLVRQHYPELCLQGIPRDADETGQVANTACGVAELLQELEAGPLAALRRMQNGSVPPIFRQLAARYPETIGAVQGLPEWMEITRILAILMRGNDANLRKPLHDPSRALGAVLCDGGCPSRWPPPGAGQPWPIFSEHRLLQLLSSRGGRRVTLMQHAARIIVRHREPGTGINVVDIASTLLKPDETRKLAESYYRRLDRAEEGMEVNE